MLSSRIIAAFRRLFSGQLGPTVPPDPETLFTRTRIDCLDCHTTLDPLDPEANYRVLRALRDRESYTNLYDKLRQKGAVPYTVEARREGAAIHTMHPLYATDELKGRLKSGRLWYEWLGFGKRAKYHERVWEHLFPLRFTPARTGSREVKVEVPPKDDSGLDVKPEFEGLVFPTGFSNRLSLLIGEPHTLAQLEELTTRIFGEEGLETSIGGKTRPQSVSDLFDSLTPRVSRDLYGDERAIIGNSDLLIVVSVLEADRKVSLPWTGLPQGFRKRIWKIVHSTQHSSEYMPRGAFEQQVIHLARPGDLPEYSYALMARFGFFIWDQQLWRPERGFSKDAGYLDSHHEQIWQSLLFARHLVGLRDGMAENGNDQEAARELEKQATKTLRRFVTHWKHPCNVILTRFIDSLQGAGSQPWATH